MKLLSRTLTLASMLLIGTACGSMAGNSMGATAGDTGANGSVNAVDGTGAAYLDPATTYDAANANTVNGGGNTTTGNPNIAVCIADLKQLRADDQNLRNSAAFTAAENSNAFQAVLTAAKTAEQAGCKSILTASPNCQTDITALDNAVQAFWKSAAFTTLTASAPYKAVQADLTALNNAGCFHALGCDKDGDHGGGGAAGNPNGGAANPNNGGPQEQDPDHHGGGW